MVSISRKKPARPVRAATTRGALAAAVAAGPKKTLAELSGDETANTMAWFEACRALLIQQIDTLDATLDFAEPEDKEGLRRRQAECADQKAALAQQQEAFFQDGTLALNPPDAADVQRTKDLAGQMDALIRSQKRAEAIAGLVGELANLVQKVGVAV